MLPARLMRTPKDRWTLKAQTPKRTVCFYDTSSSNRSIDHRFSPENIDPFLCTNIIVSYANVANNALDILDPDHLSTLFSRGVFEKCTDLKKMNPSLLISLSLDGIYDSDVSNETVRKSIVQQALEIVSEYKFDGIGI